MDINVQRQFQFQAAVPYGQRQFQFQAAVPHGKNSFPLYQEAGWAPEFFWTFLEKGKIFCSIWEQTMFPWSSSP
jgi:hypothetical protein